MLRFKSLGSGSSGNATLVDTGPASSQGRLLVDCGLGLRQMQTRLAAAGVLPAEIDAIFITHEHSDHIGSAVAFSRQFQVALWMSAGTHSAIGSPDLGGLLQIARDDQYFELGALRVTPFTVPHDAREPLQLSVADGHTTLGILTDLGHASAHVLRHLESANTLLLECNHDSDLLVQGGYPAFLKKRVGGPLGHLANTQSAQIASTLKASGSLRQVVAAHLSAQNNRPSLAQACVAQALACAPEAVRVASATDGTPWITVAAET
jgi:phosphoribosyl 1,2-cyclic phosphodiesterase